MRGGGCGGGGRVGSYVFMQGRDEVLAAEMGFTYSSEKCDGSKLKW